MKPKLSLRKKMGSETGWICPGGGAFLPGCAKKVRLVPLFISLVAFPPGCDGSPASVSVQEGARISITPDSIDLGVIGQFEEITTTLLVGNAGSDPLAITRVKSSCNCTVSRFPLRIIQPDQEAEMYVTFRSGRMRGRVKRSVQIDSSDPDRPRSTVWITADVRKTELPRIEVSPDRWDVGVIAPGGSARQEFRVANLGDKALEISEVTAFSGCRIDGPGAMEVSPGEETSFVATLSSPVEQVAGVLGGEIGVGSNDSLSPRISIPVYAYAEGGHPEAWTDYPLWNFGALTRGEERERTFAVKNLGDGTLRVRFSRLLGEEVGVRVDRTRTWTIPPGGEGAIPVAVTKEAPLGVLQSVLIFSTNDPQRPEIDLAAVGYVGEPVEGGSVVQERVPLSRVNRREFRWFIGEMGPQETVLDRKIILWNDLDRPFRLDGLRILGARCDLSTDSIAPGEEMAIEAHFFPIQSHGVGRWDLVLRGRFGEVKQPKTMTIPVVGLLPRDSPQGDFSSRTWNIGVVETGVDLSHKIRIHNRGNRSLRVQSIQVPRPETAGIQASPPGAFEVEPGGSREVVLTLGDPFFRGTVYEQFLIKSNDPAFGEVSFVVQGYVAGIPRDAPGEGRRPLRILYSSDEMGTIGPCTCEEGQIGGFARAARLTASRGSGGLILHSGDLFGAEGPHYRLRGAATMGMLDRVGYQVMALGEGELIFGREFLDETVAGAEVSLVCANAFNVGSGTLVTGAGWTPVERGPLTVGVIGLLGPELISEERARDLGMRLEDPLSTLRRVVPEMREVCDLVVLLAHMASDRLERLLEERPDVDLVLAGHGDGRTPSPVVVGGIPWVQNCDRGKYMASLDLVLSEDGGILWAEGEEHPLEEKLGEDDEVLRLIDEYKVSLRDLPAPEIIETPGPTNLGAAACKKCHGREHARWETSRHAHALESLLASKSEYDPECLQCHTNGYLRPGGFLRPDTTPDAGGVQCESCHGPGSDHVHERIDAEPGKQARPYGAVATPDLCFGCHDSENSPHFHFDEYWPKIEHGPNAR